MRAVTPLLDCSVSRDETIAGTARSSEPLMLLSDFTPQHPPASCVARGCTRSRCIASVGDILSSHSLMLTLHLVTPDCLRVH